VLKKGSYCSNTPVQVIAANTPLALGVYSFSLRGDIADADANFFVEVKASSTSPTPSNFSEFFRIEATKHFFKNITTHCCSGQLVDEFGPCLERLSENPYLQDSMWSLNASVCIGLNNLATSSCSIDNNGCRVYRTQLHGKPITDCTAQFSPFPPIAGISAQPFSVSLPDRAQCILATSPSSYSNGSTCLPSSNNDDDFCIRGRFTNTPTARPTRVPTSRPTVIRPTSLPTKIPTARPSSAPTAVPTARPSNAPTARPSSAPTAVPTARPTDAPTARPSSFSRIFPTALR
jgi:hypothetical protein